MLKLCSFYCCHWTLKVRHATGNILLTTNMVNDHGNSGIPMAILFQFQFIGASVKNVMFHSLNIVFAYLTYDCPGTRLQCIYLVILTEIVQFIFN